MGRTRVTFEYVMIKGINDSVEDARLLAELLKGVKCKVNLIPYNESPYADFKSPAERRQAVSVVSSEQALHGHSA